MIMSNFFHIQVGTRLCATPGRGHDRLGSSATVHHVMPMSCSVGMKNAMDFARLLTPSHNLNTPATLSRCLVLVADTCGIYDEEVFLGAPEDHGVSQLSTSRWATLNLVTESRD